MLEAMRVELAGRLPLLRRGARISTDGEGQVILDARQLLFASPLDLAAICALAHATAGQAGVMFLLPDDPGVASYLQRMDVLRRLPRGTEIHGTPPPERRMDCSKVLIEVSPLSPANAQELVTRLGELAATHFSGGVAGLVFRGAGELIDNAVSHGDSPRGAFLSAKAYTGTTSRRPGFEFAVCDTGIGILNHLRGNPSYAGIPDAAAALARAIQPGVTGTAELRGYGLADLLKITHGGGIGRLVLRSGDGIASIALQHGGRRETFAAASLPVTGTWAWLRVRFP